MQKPRVSLKQYFISGLVILLPAAISIWVVVFIVNFLTQPFTGLVVDFLSSWQVHDLSIGFLSHEQIIFYGSQLIILIGLLLLIVFLGFLARSFFLNLFFKFSDYLIKKIPLINKFHKTSKEIVKTLFVTNKSSFKQVVLAPFPSSDVYCLGLVARDAPPECSSGLNDLISVLIPTTPNPTTGFLLLLKREDLIFLEMKRDEAVKYIVSCGVITPKKKGEKP